MRRWKHTIVFLYSLVGIMAIICGVLIFWAYEPSDVLVVHNAPVPVRPARQQSDQLVFLIVNYCKNIGARGTVRRTLISKSVRIALPIQTDTGPKTCQQVDVPVLLPKGIEPDVYTVHIEVTYQVNPLKSTVEVIDSQPFTVE